MRASGSRRIAAPPTRTVSMAELETVPPHGIREFHLPTGKAERRELGSTECLDVGFEVDSPGLIILAAATGAWGATWELLPRPLDAARAPHKLELFRPGGGAAVGQRSSEVPESNLVVELPAEG